MVVVVSGPPLSHASSVPGSTGSWLLPTGDMEENILKMQSLGSHLQGSRLGNLCFVHFAVSSAHFPHFTHVPGEHTRGLYEMADEKSIRCVPEFGRPTT